MRVIAGKARSMPLKTLKSNDVRPTTDRIKETLFNILMPYIPGGVFLDLFSGAGAIGIEALSRGAKRAVFVERNKEACDIIKQNLKFTHLGENAEIIKRDASDAVSELRELFDVIFMDPPYGMKMGHEILEVLEDSGIADENTLIVLEEDLSDDINEGDVISGFKVTRIKKYKSNRHIFFRRNV